MLNKDNQAEGPYTLDELALKKITPDTWVCAPFSAPVQASQIPELAKILHHPPRHSFSWNIPRPILRRRRSAGIALLTVSGIFLLLAPFYFYKRQHQQANCAQQTAQLSREVDSLETVRHKLLDSLAVLRVDSFERDSLIEVIQQTETQVTARLVEQESRLKNLNHRFDSLKNELAGHPKRRSRSQLEADTTRIQKNIALLTDSLALRQGLIGPIRQNLANEKKKFQLVCFNINAANARIHQMETFVLEKQHRLDSLRVICMPRQGGERPYKDRAGEKNSRDNLYTREE